MAAEDQVSKVQVIVVQKGERWNLLSSKRAEGTKCGKWEMLGGHMDEKDHDDPLKTLVRELGEEEQTRTLAKLVHVKHSLYEGGRRSYTPHISHQDFTATARAASGRS